jgi:hypothetical protein
MAEVKWCPSPVNVIELNLKVGWWGKELKSKVVSPKVDSPQRSSHEKLMVQEAGGLVTRSKPVGKASKWGKPKGTKAWGKDSCQGQTLGQIPWQGKNPGSASYWDHFALL